MEHRINLDELSNDKFVSISSEEYDELRHLQKIIRGNLHAEETYDVFIGNYIAFEETVTSWAIREMAGRHNLLNLDFFDPAKRECHRALANFLHAGRAFEEQSKRVVSDVHGKGSAQYKKLEASLRGEYDETLGYRVLSGLRNHAQHQGMAVTGVGFGHRMRNPKEPKGGVVITVTPYIHVERLQTSDKFPKRVLREMEEFARKDQDNSDGALPVIPFVRQYVSSLSRILKIVREVLKVSGDDVVSHIRFAYERHVEPVHEGEHVSLMLERVDEGVVVESSYVSTWDWRTVTQLRDVNRPLQNLHRTVVEN